MATKYQEFMDQSAPSGTSSPSLTSYQKFIQNASSPSVDKAREYLGQQAYQGLCERFAEAVTDGKTGQYGSAVDAWNSYVQNGQAQGGITSATPGSLLYFSPNSGNDNDGHVGIYSGDGKFISATDNGIQELPVGEWEKQTGQTLLGTVSK